MSTMSDNQTIRDEIATLLGWNPPAKETLSQNHWSRIEDGQLVRCSTHPVGNSLDVVASLLPAGWNIKVEKDNSNTEFPIWNAYADQPEGYGSAFNSASTELEARLMNLREILQHEKKEEKYLRRGLTNKLGKSSKKSESKTESPAQADMEANPSGAD